jgi:hypothetical protein
MFKTNNQLNVEGENMKRLLIAVASVLSMVSVMPVFADESTSQRPQNAEANFETMKADYLTKLEKQLSSIEQQRTCVQKAKNQEDLKACIWHHKAEMKEPRKDMSKMGGSIGTDRKMHAQTK